MPKSLLNLGSPNDGTGSNLRTVLLSIITSTKYIQT